MDQGLILQAHQDLDAEVRRLGLAYQRALVVAAQMYERGLFEAQTEFEEKLNEALTGQRRRNVRAATYL
jgi:hypothetical protein